MFFMYEVGVKRAWGGVAFSILGGRGGVGKRILFAHLKNIVGFKSILQVCIFILYVVYRL